MDDPYFMELYMKDHPEMGSYVHLLDKLNIFQEDEEYNLVKDMQDGFKKSLSKTTYDRLFDQLPEHVFWDIKVPRDPPQGTRPPIGKYNPLKPYQYLSFLDFKYDDEYFYRRIHNPNLDEHKRINKHY